MKYSVFICLSLIFLGCETEDLSTNYDIPMATNGIKFHNGLLWTTDLYGQTITAFDPISGFIQDQHDLSSLNADPDDLVFLDDNTIIWTAPSAGLIGKINPDGQVSVISEGIVSVNPIELSRDKKSIYVGSFDANTNGQLQEINISTGEKRVIASNLPRMNGFSLAEDDLLYIPLFDLENLFEVSGGIIKIDPTNGSIENWEVSFPNEANKSRFKYTTATVSDNNGSVYVLESLSPAIYKVDIITAEARKIGSAPTLTSDNIAISPEEKIYVTTFIQNIVFEFDNEGNRRRISIKNR